jgi:hypothetical protein
VIILETEPGAELAAPIEAFERYFSAQGWEVARHGDEEIAASVAGAWAGYELRALWRSEDRVLQVIAMTGLAAPEGLDRGPLYEAIGRVNEQLWLGHFELWSADGAIVFRHAVVMDPAPDDEDEAALSLAQAETLAEAALDECDRYWPVFDFVLRGGHTPAEALAAAMTDVQGEA